MKSLKTLIIISCLCAPTSVFAYGEGGDIPADSRAMHLLVNETRSDIQHALSQCGANCNEGVAQYGTQITPVWWNDDLHRAAQFHSTMLASVGECLSHNSLCTLKDNITGCDGSPSCACTTGVASCNSSGTTTFDRIKKFAKNASGEIIFSGSDAGDSFTAFYTYLHEDGKETNGHRKIILDANNKSVGFGDKEDNEGSVWDTGDFGSVATSNSAITAGAYYHARSEWPEIARVGDGKLWFKMHYYASTPIQKATISLNGQCSDLNAVVGNSTNGTYGIAPSTQPNACTEFFYEAIDSSGKITRFPTTGVLLYNCNASWKASSSTASCLQQNNVDPSAKQLEYNPLSIDAFDVSQSDNANTDPITNTQSSTISPYSVYDNNENYNYVETEPLNTNKIADTPNTIYPSNGKRDSYDANTYNKYDVERYNPYDHRNWNRHNNHARKDKRGRKNFRRDYSHNNTYDYYWNNNAAAMNNTASQPNNNTYSTTTTSTCVNGILTTKTTTYQNGQLIREDETTGYCN